MTPALFVPVREDRLHTEEEQPKQWLLVPPDGIPDTCRVLETDRHEGEKI
jgi:hypothetical protein